MVSNKTSLGTSITDLKVIKTVSFKNTLRTITRCFNLCSIMTACILKHSFWPVFLLVWELSILWAKCWWQIEEQCQRHGFPISHCSSKRGSSLVMFDTSPAFSPHSEVIKQPKLRKFVAGATETALSSLWNIEETWMETQNAILHSVYTKLMTLTSKK